MFPVERTPHAKRAAQVRRTMAEMYEDPKEKEKQVGHKTPAPNQLSLSLSILCLTQSLASFQRRRIRRGTARSCGSRWWSSGLSARGSVTL